MEHINYKTRPYLLLPFIPNIFVTYKVTDKHLTKTYFGIVETSNIKIEGLTTSKDFGNFLIAPLNLIFGTGSLKLTGSSVSPGMTIKNVYSLDKFKKAIDGTLPLPETSSQILENPDENLVSIKNYSGDTVIYSGKAIYKIDDDKVKVVKVWNSLENMFLKRHLFWHRSFGDLEPTIINDEGYPIEFIARGSSGAEYPVRILDWNLSEKRIKFTKEPSMNPSKIVLDFNFVCSYYTIQITKNQGKVNIEITYETEYKRKSGIINKIISAHKISAHKDIEREINWFSTGIPFAFRGSIKSIEMIK